MTDLGTLRPNRLPFGSRRPFLPLRMLFRPDDPVMTEPTSTVDAPRWTRKHLLSLEELSADEIRLVLDTASSFKEVSTRSVKKVPALRGKVVVNAFFDDSTRTRTSFSLAASRLSADVI